MKLLNSFASSIAVASLALALASTAGAQTPVPAASAPAQQSKLAHKRGAKSKPAQPAAAKSAAGAKAAEGQPAETASRRDPFVSLLNASKTDTGANLPPGKAGLVIASIRVDGAIKSQSGMIAVVSNPQQRVYFVREGDRLYDGEVEKINLDEVVFRETSKDAFGKPVEREVTKRLYASAGEQQ
jgi:Pilus assembly protein, PilP